MQWAQTTFKKWFEESPLWNLNWCKEEGEKREAEASKNASSTGSVVLI